MCGRFSLFDMLGLKVRFNLDLPDFISPRYNIAPSQEVLAIINDEGNQAVQFRWGLIPFWSKDISSKGLINARTETIHKKPSFKQSLKHRRCLIPADGFYEWMKEESGKRPYRITLKSGEVFAFAGLWDTWISPQGDKINSCTIITTSANTLLEPIHKRMPVILDKEKEEVWLDPETDNETFKSILKPYPAELMKSYEVSTAVNSPRNDVPEVVKPV